MIIPIPCQHKRFTLGLKIQAHSPLSIGIVVYDPAKPNTHYFRRKLRFTTADFNGRRQAERRIEVPLPITPNYLELELYNKATLDDEGFNLKGFEAKPLGKTELWASPEHHCFMEFAITFAQKAGYVPAGYYDSPSHEFLIHYLNEITDEFGVELVTPARISRHMPRVQLSRKLMRQFSIPVRVAILSHEACHYFLNTRSEQKADLCGIKYYLDYGFPKIEAVYAATKVFGMHADSVGEPHLRRTAEIMNFIDRYKGGAMHNQTGKPSRAA